MNRFAAAHPEDWEERQEGMVSWMEAEGDRIRKEEPCALCGGQGVVPVAGPDENGQYDTDDCPECSKPDD